MQAKKVRKRQLKKLKKKRKAKLKELVQKLLAELPVEAVPALPLVAPALKPAIAPVAELEEKKEEKEKAIELLEEKIVAEPHKVAEPLPPEGGVDYRPLPPELKELKENLYKVANPESYERIRELETRAARGTLAPRDIERIESYGKLFERLRELRPEYIESKAVRELFERERIMLEHIESYRGAKPWEERRKLEKRGEKEKKRLEY